MPGTQVNLKHVMLTFTLQQRMSALDALRSSKLEPLGKGFVRGHKIPDGLGTQLPFGTAVHAKVQSSVMSRGNFEIACR